MKSGESNWCWQPELSRLHPPSPSLWSSWLLPPPALFESLMRALSSLPSSTDLQFGPNDPDPSPLSLSTSFQLFHQLLTCQPTPDKWQVSGSRWLDNQSLVWAVNTLQIGEDKERKRFLQKPPPYIKKERYCQFLLVEINSLLQDIIYAQTSPCPQPTPKYCRSGRTRLRILKGTILFQQEWKLSF